MQSLPVNPSSLLHHANKPWTTGLASFVATAIILLPVEYEVAIRSLTEQHNRIIVEDAEPGWSCVTFAARFVPAEGTTIEEIAAINREVFAAAAAGIGRLLDVAIRPIAAPFPS